MKKITLAIVMLCMVGCGSSSKELSDASAKSEVSSSGVVLTVDNGVCAVSQTNTTCRGNIYMDGQLKTPSTIGLAVNGLCQAGICCMGCWDGSECQYFNDTNCSDPSVGPANGLPCSGPCQSGQNCKLGGSSAIPSFFFSCQR